LAPPRSNSRRITWTSIVATSSLFDPRFPPRPRVLDPLRPQLSLMASTTAPPRPPPVNKSPSVHGSRFLPPTRPLPGPRTEPILKSSPPPRTTPPRPFHWTKTIVYMIVIHSFVDGSIRLPITPTTRSPATPRRWLLQGPATVQIPALAIPVTGSTRLDSTPTPLTTARSGRLPGPEADSSGPGCSARGTSAATGPGLLS
jgi:hypothetical protein